jgi:hypothetical protein
LGEGEGTEHFDAGAYSIEWRVESGEWRVESGEWRVESGVATELREGERDWGLHSAGVVRKS